MNDEAQQSPNDLGEHLWRAAGHWHCTQAKLSAFMCVEAGVVARVYISNEFKKCRLAGLVYAV